MKNAVWSMNRKEPSDLACAIARDIFESMGAHRIAFLGGEYPDNETDMGGFCEEAFAMRLDISLLNELFKKTDPALGQLDSKE